MGNGHRDLKVWQQAMDLTIKIYSLSRQFPKDEMYGLTSQMRRSAVSVPSNIAEGHGRGGKEFVRFLDIAYGSLLELETQLEIAQRIKYLNDKDANELLTVCAEIGKMLNGLKKSLTQKLK